MGGTVIGGKAAAITNKLKYGESFYSNIGAIGGSVTGVSKGFAANRDRASKAGKAGGLVSRRTGIRNGEGLDKNGYRKLQVKPPIRIPVATQIPVEYKSSLSLYRVPWQKRSLWDRILRRNK